MKEKLKYNEAEYEIIYFDDTDVITTSVPEEGNDGDNIDGGAWH